MNDKCAAGTGRFLEVMAGVLGLAIEEMGPASLASSDPCAISSTCTIFAETEMVSLRAEGRNREDLVAGIHRAVASRVTVMGRTIGYSEQVVFTGGVAKNIGVKNALEAGIGLPILIPEEPQIMGALGAALLAGAELRAAA
jgi:predicted CoA-substrate-specific enzyme activase